MPAYNFKSRFAEAVASGRKAQTIRLIRKDGRHPVPGARLLAYKGLRTRFAEKLIEGTITSVNLISIEFEKQRVLVDRSPLTRNQALQIAQLDGFDDVSSFVDFFLRTHGGNAFQGQLIRWKPLANAGN